LKPLCIDLFCGLGGWAEGFIAEGWDVIGFDIERHEYDDERYPGQLVLQDARTLHGSQFLKANAIVASPPCTEPSYRAMPWKRAKALNAAGPPHAFIELFETCFRIQREACEAAGRPIPMIVENVKGAQPWVGRAAWHFGSFYLWGDVPALMPRPAGRKGYGGSWWPDAQRPGIGDPRDAIKIPGQDWSRYARTGEVSPHWNMSAVKVPGVKQGDEYRLTQGKKMPGQPNTHRIDGTPSSRFTTPHELTGEKASGKWFGPYSDRARDTINRLSSGSNARKAASARIAKIPPPLAQHIARVFKP
jgi:hypothetical protein